MLLQHNREPVRADNAELSRIASSSIKGYDAGVMVRVVVKRNQAPQSAATARELRRRGRHSRSREGRQ